MGWLRDLMAASEPKLHSYGELARRCLDHAAWPLDIQPQARSLASLYSKFDRGIEVEWLHDRPEVQVVLAQVLQVPATSLATEVKKHVASADQQQSRWRLRDAPSSRPIDLREEPLPPIFPDSLLRPGLWSCLWWRDGNHQGAELLGRWLQARALAEFAVCFEWRQVVERAAIGTGPLFVLYWGDAIKGASLQASARPLCLVGMGPTPAPNFVTVETPPFASLEPVLLGWLCSLLPADGKQPPSELAAWLQGWASEGLTLDFDTVAGLVGNASQLQLDARLPLEALATKYLTQRLDLAEEAGTREAKWLRQHGLDLPIGIAKNAVRTAGDVPWDIPRTKAEWLELVPDEYQRGVDADWTRVSLQRAGTPLTVAELEKALSQVPPGGFRVLNTLCDAHVLEEVADGKFAVHPRWFGQFLEAAAYSALLDEAADEWGQVGLVQHRISPLLQALGKQFDAGAFQTLDAALELDDHPTAPFVLAVELLVVATGRALLRGVEFETEQMTGLLGLQRSFLLERLTPFAAPFVTEPVPLPRPRLLCLTSDAAWGEWLLCLWSLSELSERSDAATPSVVNPWSLTPSLPKPLFALLEATLGELAPTDVRVTAIYSLLGRLLQHIERVREEAEGTPGHAALVEACAAPVFAVARVLRGDGWPAWQLALTIPHGVESVKRLVAPEAWQYLAKTAWRTWLEKGADETGVRLFTETATRRQLFWPHLPDRVLQSLLDARNPLVLLVPAECMRAEWVTMYLERVPEVRELAVRYLEVIPANAIVEEHFEVLFELLESHALVDRMQPVFQTHPEAALTRLLTLLDQGRVAPASAWLAAVPSEHRVKVLDHIRQQVEQRGASYAAFGLCRAWLADLCARRTTGWTEVYPVLEECEQRHSRLTRAFPALEPAAEAG